VTTSNLTLNFFLKYNFFCNFNNILEELEFCDDCRKIYWR
jgi:hypothetical protein